MNKLLLLAVAAIGCSTVQAKTDYDRSANFGGFRTFKMLEGKTLPSESGAPPNTIVADRNHHGCVLFARGGHDFLV